MAAEAESELLRLGDYVYRKFLCLPQRAMALVYV
jgi:hypothetical protein